MTTLVVSVGDPAGIGPEVAVSAARKLTAEYAIVLVGASKSLKDMLPEATVASTVEAACPGTIIVVDSGAGAHSFAPGLATSEGGAAALRSLDAATALVQASRGTVLVTGPVSKEAIVRSGTAFSGQTEHLARAAGLAADDVSMLFLGPKLRTALVTTHVGVAGLSRAVTAPRVTRTVLHLAAAVRLLGSRCPKLVVTGLNPHAGEGGLFGDEETLSIGPGIEAAKRAAHIAGHALELVGPLPAEAAFRFAAEGRCDGVVAMFHDQATIASKLLDWGNAVNVTWGLPFVRTSVDHGVAYDIAGKGLASDEGMVAAMTLGARIGDPR